MSIFTRPVPAFIFALLVCGCSQEQATTEESVVPATSNEVVISIEAAQEQLTTRFISMPGVTGTGIGECDGKPCIKIMIEKKTPSLMSEIPSSFEGFPVVVEETGEFRTQD